MNFRRGTRSTRRGRLAGDVLHHRWVGQGARRRPYFRGVGEREFFGELTTLDPAPHSETVSATEDVRLLGLDREALYELMADHPEVLRKIIHELCDRLRRKR